MITVLPTGQLILGTTPIPDTEFEQRLQQLVDKHGPTTTELRIRADRTVPFNKVEPLLLTAARNSVTRVRFSVIIE